MPCGRLTLSDPLPRPLLRRELRPCHRCVSYLIAAGPAKMAKALKCTTHATGLGRLELQREGRCPTN